MKTGKVIRNVLLALTGLLFVLLVALQVLLRPAVLTRIVNQVAADYVEGHVNFRQVKAHVIKSFPYVDVEADDFSITYPHSRYERFDSLYPADTRRRFSLIRAGWQRDAAPDQAMDTLAAFRHLRVSLNYMALLGTRTIHVHRLELAHPRIFAHYYDSTAANWDILPIGGESDTTRQGKALPDIVLNRIALTDRPVIIFTDPADTLHGMFTMRRLQLDGELETARIDRSFLELSLDSLMISGRLPADTVSLRLQRLRSTLNERHFSLDADAQASLRSESYGRLRIPIHLDADVDLPKHAAGELEALVNSLHLGVSSVNLEGKGQLFKHRDGLIDLDMQAAVKDCPLNELMHEYENNFPILGQVKANQALISLSATAKGVYGNGQTPQVSARVDRLLVDIVGARLDATAAAEDLLGRDPLLSLDARLQARADSLIEVFTKDMGIYGNGYLEGSVSAGARLSQLDMSHIGNARIEGRLLARDLDIQAPEDSLSALLPHLEVQVETKGNSIDKNMRKGARVLALRADVDSLDVSLKEMFVRGGKMRLLAQNSADILKGGKKLTPLMGILTVGNLRLRDSDGMGVSLRDNTETFRVEPATKASPSPRLSLRSNSKGLRGRMGANLMGIRDLNFDLSATRHTARPGNTERRNRRLDSLQRVYPDIPRDSLLRHARRVRMERESQDAFAGADIKISLSQAIRQYVRDWDIQGNIGLESARAMLPSFPLKTSLSAVQGSFDNDTLALKNITLKTGASDLSAQAQLTGLRRIMLGSDRSLLKLKANVTSDYLDVNELMRGYAYYSNYQSSDSLTDASDQAVEEAIDHTQLPEETSSKLLVIPSNLEVDFSLEASGIKYDSLLVSWAAADIAMRKRTLQITNALAASNMGDIYFEGFYSTRSKEDIKAGFDLNLVDITAEKVITLFPAVDTLMPLLSTFQGDLDCELAVTSDIDTLMQLVLPSVDGVLKISGEDLTLKESKELTKIARLLMFKNKKEARIDNMSVSGIVQNNVMEIFPFVLNVDRYLLAASGTQHLNQQFDYHVSVIKSPLILKFGLNAWGPDFSHIHYGLGKARYRNAQVPVFTKQLDTVQYSLVAAIHNIFELGVEKAMEENRTEAYFGEAAQPQTQPEEAQNDVSMASLEGMEQFLTDVIQQTTARREALKEEVVRLEAALAENK